MPCPGPPSQGRHALSQIDRWIESLIGTHGRWIERRARPDQKLFKIQGSCGGEAFAQIERLEQTSKQPQGQEVLVAKQSALLGLNPQPKGQEAAQSWTLIITVTPSQQTRSTWVSRRSRRKRPIISTWRHWMTGFSNLRFLRRKTNTSRRCLSEARSLCTRRLK